MKLIKLREFREEYFVAGNAPAKDTIIRQIESGELSGRRVGNCYYVDIEEFECSQLIESIMH